MSGSGFKNITDGFKHFLNRLTGQIGDEAKDAATAVLNFLHPSIVAVENEINEHGPELLQAVTSAMAAAALAVVTGGAGTAAEIASAAGKAALAAGAGRGGRGWQGTGDRCAPRPCHGGCDAGEGPGDRPGCDACRVGQPCGRPSTAIKITSSQQACSP